MPARKETTLQPFLEHMIKSVFYKTATAKRKKWFQSATLQEKENLKQN